MDSARSPAPADTSRKNPVPPGTAKRNLVEERDWYASSRDLAEGLIVQEVDEPLPDFPFAA
jgi:hypothetical protein